jgi:hypothetical protein
MCSKLFTQPEVVRVETWVMRKKVSILDSVEVCNVVDGNLGIPIKQLDKVV